MPPPPQIAEACSSRVCREVKIMVGTTARILVGMIIGVAVCVALVVALCVDLLSEAHT